MDVIVKLDASLNLSRRVMPSVMSPLRIELQMIPAAPQLKAVRRVWIMREVG